MIKVQEEKEITVFELNQLPNKHEYEPKEFADSSAKALASADKNEVGRNDPCPCGAINGATGEVYKYKKCGLIGAPQHRKSLIN